MNRDSKESLKVVIEKYPKLRELIRAGDFDTLWEGLFDPNFNETLTGPGTALCWNPMYACFFMTAFAETDIDCKLKEIPEYLAANPITAKYLFDLKIPDGVEKIGDSAFWDCYNLTDIYIPNSVKVIDDDAFALSTIRDNKSKRNFTIPKKYDDAEILSKIGIDVDTDNITFI